MFCINKNDLDYFGNGKNISILDGATLNYIDSIDIIREETIWKNKKYILLPAKPGNNWRLLKEKLTEHI